jgi:hypothetical protein
VITSEVLEHVWDLRIVHREVKRILKRTGTYFISTPNFEWVTNHLEGFGRIMQRSDAHWAFEHIRHYSYDTHKAFLNECGFAIERHTGADGHFCPIVGSICHGIAKGLEKKGITVDEYELHKFAGQALPHYQHTIVLAARKV